MSYLNLVKKDRNKKTLYNYNEYIHISTFITMSEQSLKFFNLKYDAWYFNI